MTNPKLPIYIDRLQHGHEEVIEGSFPPEFFDIQQDDDLLQLSPITVNAKFYLAGDHVIGDISAHLTLSLRCVTCADQFSTTIEVSHELVERPIKEIKSNTWDVMEAIREELLIQFPLYPLCDGEKCKNRREVSKFFSKGQKEDHFQPFKDLPDFE